MICYKSGLEKAKNSVKDEKMVNQVNANYSHCMASDNRRLLATDKSASAPS